MADHNQNLPIKQMVLNRLPFLADTPANTTLLSQFTLEAMYELESCFRVRFLPDGTEDWARVGDEQFYGVIQRSVVADLVSIYVLMTAFMANSAGNASTNTPSLSTFLSRVKAGSVEVEYEQFDLKKGTFSIAAGDMVSAIKKDLQRKARGLGCIFDICDDCTITFQTVTPPFMVFGAGNGGCGCG